MTAPQLAELEEYERFDPSGPERLELAIAKLTSVVQCVLSAFGGGKPLPPEDIVADWGGLRALARAREMEAAGPLMPEEGGAIDGQTDR